MSDETLIKRLEDALENLTAAAKSVDAQHDNFKELYIKAVALEAENARLEVFRAERDDLRVENARHINQCRKAEIERDRYRAALEKIADAHVDGCMHFRCKCNADLAREALKEKK